MKHRAEALAARLEAGASALAAFAAGLSETQPQTRLPKDGRKVGIVVHHVAGVYGDAPVTCQFMVEDHGVRHSSHHLARIRAALAGRDVGAAHAR
jgi:hypothetical protein